MTRLALACVLGAELGITAYAAYAACLLSAWLVDARFALNARPREWWFEGLRRIGLFGVVAGLLSALSYALNLALSHYLEPLPGHALQAIAAMQVVLVLGGSLIGAAWLLWRRPFG